MMTTSTPFKKRVSFLSLALGISIMASLGTTETAAFSCDLQCTKTIAGKNTKKLNECAKKCKINNKKIIDLLVDGIGKLDSENQKKLQISLQEDNEKELEIKKVEKTKIETQLAAEAQKGEKKQSKSKIKTLATKQEKLTGEIQELEKKINDLRQSLGLPPADMPAELPPTDEKPTEGKVEDKPLEPTPILKRRLAKKLSSHRKASAVETPSDIPTDLPPPYEKTPERQAETKAKEEAESKDNLLAQLTHGHRNLQKSVPIPEPTYTMTDMEKTILNRRIGLEPEKAKDEVNNQLEKAKTNANRTDIAKYTAQLAYIEEKTKTEEDWD